MGERFKITTAYGDQMRTREYLQGQFRERLSNGFGREEIQKMTDDEFLAKVNPYAQVVEGMEDAIWYRFQCTMGLEFHYSLHAASLKYGRQKAKRYAEPGGAYKADMALYCTDVLHVGGNEFILSLMDPYGSCKTDKIKMSHEDALYCLGHLLEAEALFYEDGRYEIKRIKNVMPFTDKYPIMADRNRSKNTQFLLTLHYGIDGIWY